MSWSFNWVVFPRLHFFCLLQAPWWTTRGGLWFLGCTTVWLLWRMRRRICMTTLNLTWTNTAKIVALRSYCTGPRQAAHFSWFLSNRIVFYKLLLLSCLCYLSRVVFFFFFQCFQEQILMHRWRYPSLSLHGIEGAFSEAGAKTVIPRKVIGKFSIRLVPDMDPKVVEKQVGLNGNNICM